MSGPQVPSADRLYRRWLDLWPSGTLGTAADVAVGDPGLSRSSRPESTTAWPAGPRTWTPPCGTAPPGPPPCRSRPTSRATRSWNTWAAGAWGDVWRVRDDFDREFALKAARTDRLSAAGKVRFHAEVRAMQQVEHPSVVPVHDSGWHRETPYFLMPVYPASLRDRLAEYQADPVRPSA